MNKHSNILQNIITILFLLLVITGCGGGGGGANDESPFVVSDDSDVNNGADDAQTGDTTGAYDLAEYMFDSSLRQVGGYVSYESHMHNIQTGNAVMAEAEVSAQWEATGENTIAYSANDSEEPKTIYVIDDRSIEMSEYGSDEEPVFLTRFVSIGETYQEVVIEDTFDGSVFSRISCRVLNHLDTLDFNTVSSLISEGDYAIPGSDMASFTMDMADGVYHDVLQMNCLSTLGEAEDSPPVNDAEVFYARGIGEVLTIDKIGLFMGGPSVYIPERSGTVYYGSSQ